MKKGDYMLIAAYIMLTLIIAFFSFRGGNHASVSYVSIQVDGKEIERIKVPQEKSVVKRINTSNGYNVVEISAGGTRIKEASCRDQLCVNHSDISRVGELIVCLPNKLVIEMISGDSESDIDVVAN